MKRSMVWVLIGLIVMSGCADASDGGEMQGLASTPTSSAAPSNNPTGMTPPSTPAPASSTDSPVPIAPSSQPEPVPVAARGPAPEPPEGAVTRTMEEYCAGLIAIEAPWCDYKARCCSADDIASSVFSLPLCTEATTVESCLADLQAQMDRFTFNGLWVDACLADLQQLAIAAPEACGGTLQDQAATENHDKPAFVRSVGCRNMLSAQSPLGGPCVGVVDCVGGLGCGESDVPGEYVCQEQVPLGAACSTDSDCDPGLVCNDLFDGVCDVPGMQGADCDVDSHCANGLICQLLDGCAPPIAPGQPCPQAFFCRADSFCDFLTLTCELNGAVGAVCSSDFDCQGRCDGTNGTCVDICGGTQ